MTLKGEPIAVLCADPLTAHHETLGSSYLKDSTIFNLTHPIHELLNDMGWGFLQLLFCIPGQNNVHVLLAFP